MGGVGSVGGGEVKVALGGMAVAVSVDGSVAAVVVAVMRVGGVVVAAGPHPARVNTRMLIPMSVTRRFDFEK
jgi:hypothetical protein